ncbi:MAG TPA: hypothetical protein VHU83_00250 [Bryobacteraceae bacterium]|jgi:hypothetical protein|nr:hypothetical protein [Bryobacteraceae bacterium]
MRDTEELSLSEQQLIYDRGHHCSVNWNGQGFPAIIWPALDSGYMPLSRGQVDAAIVQRLLGKGLIAGEHFTLTERGERVFQQLVKDSN